MKFNALKLKSSLLAAVVFVASSVSMVAYAPAASAEQDATTQALQSLDAATATALSNALAAGDALAVELIVAANQGNAAANQAIATIILAAAQSIKAADPGGAGVLAAIAISSGGLQGNSAVTATNLVNVSGNGIASAVIAFSNAGVPLAIVATVVLIGVTTNPVQIAQNGANVNGNNNSCGVSCG